MRKTIFEVILLLSYAYDFVSKSTISYKANFDYKVPTKKNYNSLIINI